jgi:NAD(P)-dependent dehydrogenase (short-subunit alcohol dehydrogenase family)
MTDRTWFITGAASGFGFALTTQLLERGDTVVAFDRRTEPLERLAPSAGRLLAFTVDVTRADEVRAAVAQALGRTGGVDVGVSCAGFGAVGAAEEQSDEFIALQIAVNLTGSITFARALIPHLRAGGGRLLQVSSSGGQVPDPGMSVYNATKFGIEGFYESIAIELAPFGIEVTLVEPGGSGTSFSRNIMLAEPIEAYDNGVVGQIRAALAGDHDELHRAAFHVDPDRVAAAIIDSVAISPAPRRIALGYASYDAIEQALVERLEALRAQRDLAYAADVEGARQ